MLCKIGNLNLKFSGLISDIDIDSPVARGKFLTNWGSNSSLPSVVGIKFQKIFVFRAEFSSKRVFCRPE